MRSAPAAERPRLKDQHRLAGQRRYALSDGERRTRDWLLTPQLLAEAYHLKEGFGAICIRRHTSAAPVDA
ncbi:hypothetical protein [Azospirillum argentinense]